jgi:hypothetical protein
MVAPPNPNPGTASAAAAIKRRYGMTGWGTTTANGVYDVVRESPIVDKYGKANTWAASRLVAQQLSAKAPPRKKK